MKKITAIVMALVVAISGMTIMPWKVEAASNLKINGVDIGYAPKQYFSETGKQCTCHNQGICAPQKAGCVCKHVSGTAQCYAFALWCENKMFGYNDVSKPTKFKSVGSIAAGKVDKDSIKKLISKTPIGAHIRTGGSAHSMILVSKTDKGFTVAQANGGNNNEYSGYYRCRIGTSTYTWSGYAKSSYGKRGISFVKIPKDMKVKLDAPTLKSGQVSGNTAVLAWNKVSGASKYKVTRHELNNTNKKTFYTSELKYTDKSLKPATVYYYTVYAVGANNEASERSLIYRAYTQPSAPTGLAVKGAGESQLTVSWNKVSGAKKYKLLFREAGKSWKVLKNDLTTNSYTHKGLSAGKKYEYQAVAICVGEVGIEGKRATKSIESAQSKTTSGFTKMKRPKNQVNQNPTDVILNWDAAQGDQTYVYNVYRDGSSTPINGAGTYITGTSYTDTKATSGKIHKYQIELVERSNSSYTKQGSSDVFYAGSKITKGISVTPESETAMQISWDTPSSAPSGIKYVIQKYNETEGKYVACAETTNTYYTDTEVTAGETYKYYIQMLDEKGNYLTETWEKSAVLEITADRIILNKSSVVLKKGESITLEATVEPDGSTDKNVTWTSSDDTVAVVNNGVVTAKAEGSARIAATTTNGKTAVCTIQVPSTQCSHNYGGWVTDQQAGCEQQGSQHRTCSICQAEETAPIPATGHSYSQEWKMVKKATCQEEGKQARVCTKCQAETDITVIGTTEHVFGDTWEVSKEPTCSEAGNQYRACTVCGTRETEIIDASDHNYELTSQTEPTLDGPGTRTYTCQNCKASYTEEWVKIVEEGEVSIGGATANVGATVKIPVTIADNPGIAGFTFQINYDKSVLTPTEITAGELLKKDGNVIGTFTSNLEQGVPAANLESVTVHWNNSSGVTGDGNLFYITFTVIGKPEKNRSPIWLTYEDGDIVNQRIEEIKPDILDNVITVANVMRGDVNLNGTVDIHDGILLAKYLARWNISFTESQMEAADVYIDNKVNVKDGVRLAQLLAGYGDTEDTDTAEARTYLAAAESKPQISVENFEGVAGDTIYLPVRIDKNTGIAGFDLELKYDSSYLTPVSVEKGGLLEEGDFSSNLDEGSESAAETIAVHWSNVDNVAEDGELFAVEFEIKADTELGKTLPVEISNVQDAICDKNLDTVEVSLAQGGVKTVTHSEDIVDPHDFDVYKIEGVSMKSSSGAACEEIPANGDFDVAVSFSSTADEVYPAEFVAAAYDANGALLATASKAITQEMLSEETLTGNCSLHIGKTTAKIAEIKVFLWDSSHGMAPLAEPITISKKAL